LAGVSMVDVRRDAVDAPLVHLGTTSREPSGAGPGRPVATPRRTAGPNVQWCNRVL
jgi:hypothetical protein